MGEPLKKHFDARVPRAIAKQISEVWPEFPTTRFLADVLRDYDDLELMDRGRSIGRALGRHLPDDFPTAIDILMRSIDVPRPNAGTGGMASFYYLPHTSFVAESGIDHFDESMRAQYKLTQLFTAEFSVRPFIERHEQKSLGLLRRWANDPNHHVRRLVSEGTRPRLPWGSRLRRFQENPAPVIKLLELLKDDPEIYVRRSVANNLNDIGKDHPDVLLGVARRWMKGASSERLTLVRHALRSLIKQGNPEALALLGFGGAPKVSTENVVIDPKRVTKGAKVVIGFNLLSRAQRSQKLLVDLRVYFVKANGKPSPKVFKLKSVELQSGETATFRKTITLAELTTRKHHPGRHEVEALINGIVFALGSFRVVDSVLR